MILLSALLLAASPAPVPRAPARPRVAARATATAAPTGEWLRGLWVSDANKGDQMEGCASYTAVYFQSDGHYLDGEVTGRWQVAKGALTRTPFAPREGGGDDDEVLGTPVEQKIVRISADRMRLVDAKGKATLYLRCPRPETPVAR